MNMDDRCAGLIALMGRLRDFGRRDWTCAPSRFCCAPPLTAARITSFLPATTLASRNFFALHIANDRQSRFLFAVLQSVLPPNLWLSAIQAAPSLGAQNAGAIVISRVSLEVNSGLRLSVPGPLREGAERRLFENRQRDCGLLVATTTPSGSWVADNRVATTPFQHARVPRANGAFKCHPRVAFQCNRSLLVSKFQKQNTKRTWPKQGHVSTTSRRISRRMAPTHITLPHAVGRPRRSGYTWAPQPGNGKHKGAQTKV